MKILIDGAKYTMQVVATLLGLSNYRDSIHYCDSLTLFMNKIVGCWNV